MYTECGLFGTWLDVVENESSQVAQSHGSTFGPSVPPVSGQGLLVDDT